MATFTDKFSSGGATLKLTVTRSSYSIEDNTSYLKCVLQITKNQAYSSYNNGGASISMTINGSKLYSSDTFDIRSLSVGSTKTLATKYITVEHNSDGTKSVTCKASFTSGVALGSASISDTYTCGTIPRASSLSLSKTSVYVGDSITANITRNSTSFVHDVEFFFGGWGAGSQNGIDKKYYYKETGVKWSVTYKIPSQWYNLMSDSTSHIAWFRITTRDEDSGNQIGSKVEKSFTVKVPSSIVPTVGDITFNPHDISPGGDILVQGKNKFTLSVSGCTAGTGSSIKSYTFSGPGLTTTTQSGTSIEGGPTSSGGDLTYTVKVTDKRGRSASKTITVNCYKYAKPYFSYFNPYRANADGTANPNGAYIRCDYTPVYSSTSGLKNNATVKATAIGNNSTKTANGKSGMALIPLDGDTTTTFKVSLTITDKYGGTGTSSTKTVTGAFRVINVSPNGTGVAFGKMSETNECLESKYRIWTRENFTAKENGYGLWLTNKSNSAEPAVIRNTSDNLWIGAKGESEGHITGGGTYISAGDKSNIYVNKKKSDGTRDNYRIIDSNNRYDVLYSASDPYNAGTITLSASAADYTYLEIFYCDNLSHNGSYLRSSMRVYSPDGKGISTTIIDPVDDETRLKIKTSYYIISGKTMTKKNSTYASITNAATDVYIDGTSSNVTPSSHIKITRVLGYK